MDEYSKQLKHDINKLKVKLETYKIDMLELQQRGDIQDSLNEMLNISLQHISLQQQMEKILLLVLNIPWLSLDKKGCVFLTDKSGKGLKMVAHHNLGDSLLGMCDQIKFGQCLCGKAAQQQQLIFRDCIDDDHDIRPEGIQPHGHYNMPIISNGETLGVLNLYVKHGHKQTGLEKEFLKASAKAMASIIERKKIEERLFNLSYSDELTQVANRRQFMKYLSNLIVESIQSKQSFALLFIDLDLFKQVNDNHGHDTGDQILVKAAGRIKQRIRDTDFVARLGGDEFVVVLEDLSEISEIMRLGKELIQALSAPYEVLQQAITIGASVGISLCPENGTETADLLMKADRALYQAKDKRGEVILYDAIAVKNLTE